MVAQRLVQPYEALVVPGGTYNSLRAVRVVRPVLHTVIVHADIASERLALQVANFRRHAIPSFRHALVVLRATARAKAVHVGGECPHVEREGERHRECRKTSGRPG